MLFKRTNNKLSVEINKLKLLCVTTSSIAMLAFTDAQAAALWDQITNARLKLNKPKEITNNLPKPSQENKFFNYDMLNNFNNNINADDSDSDDSDWDDSDWDNDINESFGSNNNSTLSNNQYTNTINANNTITKVIPVATEKTQPVQPVQQPKIQPNNNISLTKTPIQLVENHSDILLVKTKKADVLGDILKGVTLKKVETSIEQTEKAVPKLDENAFFHRMNNSAASYRVSKEF
jgi:hypothetical protein